MASPTAAAGAKTRAKVVEVAREHLAVTAADQVGRREMLEVVNGFVELASIAGLSRLEFLETARDFFTVLDLMAVEAGAARSLESLGQTSTGIVRPFHFRLSRVPGSGRRRS